MMQVNATTTAAEELNAPVRRKTTSVGFEFDLWTADQKNNPYFGLTHFCLAKSTEGFGDFELPYFLETDAHSTIELVTPPYSVEVEEGTNSVPDKTQFQALKSNVTAQVQEVANEFNGRTLAEATEGVWKINGHGIGWERSEEKPESHHWNIGAGKGEGVIGSIETRRVKGTDFDFKLQSKGKGKLDPPQVNFATYLYELDKASKNVGMNNRGRVEFDSIFNTRSITGNPAKFFSDLTNTSNYLKDFIDLSIESNIASFAINKSGLFQKMWKAEGNAKEKMTINENQVTSIASYVKDFRSVWVKTDPVTALASSKLEIIKSGDVLEKKKNELQYIEKGVDHLGGWIEQKLGEFDKALNTNAGGWNKYVQLLLEGFGDENHKGFYEEIRKKILNDVQSMRDGLEGLQEVMGKLIKAAAEKGGSDFNIEAQREILIEYIKSRDSFLKSKGTEMNVDNPKMLGCRQDTYIAPSKTFRGWGGDDGESVEGIKVVVEGRNPKS